MLLRACVTAALGASLLHAQRAATPALPRADSLDDVLVQLAVHDAGSTTVRAFRGGDEAWLPVAALLVTGDVAYKRANAGSFAITLATGRRVTIDAVTSTVLVNGARNAVAQGALFVRDGETYAASHALAAWLGIRFEIKWDELRVTALGEKQPPPLKIVWSAPRHVL